MAIVKLLGFGHVGTILARSAQARPRDKVTVLHQKRGAADPASARADLRPFRRELGH